MTAKLTNVVKSENELRASFLAELWGSNEYNNELLFKNKSLVVPASFYKVKRNNKRAYFMEPVFIRGLMTRERIDDGYPCDGCGTITPLKDLKDGSNGRGMYGITLCAGCLEKESIFEDVPK